MTTYIKRVPQFKAVQFQLSKESYNEIRNLSPEHWSDMYCKMISQMGRMTITFNGDHDRLVTASEGDWVVRELDGTLSVMTDDDFKAQYEAAPQLEGLQAQPDKQRECYQTPILPEKWHRLNPFVVKDLGGKP